MRRLAIALLVVLLVVIALIKEYVPIRGAATTGPIVVVGIASWGDFGGHVVTRLPRGTSILVTGPLGAWTGSSWGYGPDPDIFPERIVDLDREVFRWICGDPSIGTCEVTLRR